MKVDILYTAWNRLEFTTQTWAWMLAHTNWDYVRRIIVYDDGSEDGTLEFLRDEVAKLQDIPRFPRTELRESNFGAPAAIMNHYLATKGAEAFAKVDNDIALPGGWLERMVWCMEAHPELELLGMEAGMVAMQGRDGVTHAEGIEPCSHIGGVGLMRRSAFESRPSIPYRGRQGFTEWQNRYEPTRAWIVPDMDCPQLDRLPFEPWASLAEEYIDKGWAREWGKYDAKWMKPYWSWMT